MEPKNIKSRARVTALCDTTSAQGMPIQSGTTGTVLGQASDNRWAIQTADSIWLLQDDHLRDPSLFAIHEPVANSVLVHVVNGVVRHRFCTEELAIEHMSNVATMDQPKVAFVVTNEPGQTAQQMYDSGGRLRQHVDDTVKSIASHLRLQAAMDAYGIPKDRDLRTRIGWVCSSIGVPDEIADLDRVQSRKPSARIDREEHF